MQYEVNLLKPGTISDFSRRIKATPLPLNVIALSLSFTTIFCLSYIIATGIYLPRRNYIASRSVKEGEIVKQIEAVKSTRESIKEKIDQLTELKKEDINWAEKLKDLSTVVPEGIRLTGIKVVEEKERAARRTAREIADSTDENSYNLFGEPIEKPKKLLYIMGSVDVNSASAPLAVLNRFVSNLIQQNSFKRDFEMLDWRLIGEDRRQYMRFRSISEWEGKIRAQDGLNQEEPKQTVEFELKMGIKPGSSPALKKVKDLDIVPNFLQK